MTGHEDHCIEDLRSGCYLATTTLPQSERGVFDWARQDPDQTTVRVDGRPPSEAAGVAPEVDTALEHGYRMSYTIV